MMKCDAIINRPSWPGTSECIIMQIVQYIEQIIFNSAKWKMILIIVTIMLVRTGIWCIPNIDSYLLIAQDPFTNPFQDDRLQNLYWNWLGPFLAYFVGAKDRWSFFALHLMFSLGFTALFIGTVFRWLPDRTARVSLVVFSVLPVSTTAYFWVSTDSLTLLLMMGALALPEQWAAASLFGAALGMQHFEQAILGFSGLLIALLLSRWYGNPNRYSLAWSSSLLIGIIAGKIMLISLFYFIHVTVSYGRIKWLMDFYDELLRQFLFHFHYIIWSSLGIGWFVAIQYFEKTPFCRCFAIPLAILLLLLPISADQTRVFAVTSFPLISAFWLLSGDLPSRLSNRFVSWLFLAWLIVPWNWAFNGMPRWSAFPYNVAYLLNHSLGWSSVPQDLEDLAGWPFGAH
jgi:hypothetical protein